MNYEIPPDTREKEKIFGGLFTLTQTIFLALAAVCGGGTFLGLFGSMGAIPSLLIGVVIGSIFLPFAFIKVESCGNVELIQYIWILFQYQRSQKVYVNINDNYRDAILHKEVE